jgi:predicted site-specific integrase-resolvase
MENANSVFYRTKKAALLYGVHPCTLRQWADDGRIPFKRTLGNQRVYDVTHLLHPQLNLASPTDTTGDYLYVRVSSSKQGDDLDRQLKYLESHYPNATVIKDIASGLNFRRKGLFELLELAQEGKVKRVVVASKDRLCRFGFDLIEWILRQHAVELVVLDKTDKSPEQEFTEDILAILQVFACRWNGKRKYIIKNKKGPVEVNVSPREDANDLESPLPVHIQQGNESS